MHELFNGMLWSDEERLSQVITFFDNQIDQIIIYLIYLIIKINHRIKLGF